MNTLRNQEGKAIAAVLAIVAVVVVVIIVLISNNKTEEEVMVEKATDMMYEGETMMEEGQEMMEEGQEMMEEMGYRGEVLAGDTTPLIAFTQADFEKAQEEGKTIMLYFYASWCPVCKKELKNALIPAFNELNDPNVVAFLVNYKDKQTDKYEEDLARLHGIGYQHTRVFYDGEGNVIEKTGPVAWDKQQYLDYFTNL